MSVQDDRLNTSSYDFRREAGRTIKPVHLTPKLERAEGFFFSPSSLSAVLSPHRIKREDYPTVERGPGCPPVPGEKATLNKSGPVAPLHQTSLADCQNGGKGGSGRGMGNAAL